MSLKSTWLVIFYRIRFIMRIIANTPCPVLANAINMEARKLIFKRLARNFWKDLSYFFIISPETVEALERLFLSDLRLLLKATLLLFFKVRFSSLKLENSF